MIPDPQIERRPIRVLFDYFERAMEDLGLGPWLGLLRPGNEDYFQNRIRARVYQALSVETWKRKRVETLSEPEKHLQWEPWEDPEEEIWAHYRMQSAIAATLMGDSEELKTLAAQLITEPMNRKLAISYFLGNLTEGKVGLIYKELPTKAQVLKWVRESGEIPLTYRLGEIAILRYE